MVQTISYGCCGKIFAGSIEPHCYTDKDWQKELRKYVQQGCKVALVDASDFRFGTCECKKEEMKINENQIALF